MKTYDNPTFSINTERKHTDVVTGATITLTTADARALYALASYPSSEDFDEDELEVENYKRMNQCRSILHGIAKRILMTEGESTVLVTLVDKLVNPESRQYKPKTYGKINIDSHE